MTEDSIPSGGVFSGADGRLSGRRIIGTALVGWGAALITLGQIQTGGDLLSRVIPGVILLAVGALFWGMVTVQSLREIAGAVRGGGQ